MIWFKNYTIEDVIKRNKRITTMIDFMGIEFTELTDNTLSARMPIDERTRQPYGIMHGGASCALAESVGSIAGNLIVDPEKRMCVGLDIFTSHLKMVKSGFVTGTARPIRIGNSIQVWEIDAKNEKGELVSITRLTLAVIDKR